MEDDGRDSGAGGVSGEAGPDLTLEMALSILRRRKGAILVTALLGTALATIVGLQVTPRYTANALVIIEQREANVTNFQRVVGGFPAADPSIIDTQIKVLASRDNLRRVVDQLGLARDAESGAPASWLQLKERLLTRHLWRMAQSWWRTTTGWVPEGWLTAVGMAGEPLVRLHAPDVIGYAGPAERGDALKADEAALIACRARSEDRPGGPLIRDRCQLHIHRARSRLRQLPMRWSGDTWTRSLNISARPRATPRLGLASGWP